MLPAVNPVAATPENLNHAVEAEHVDEEVAFLDAALAERKKEPASCWKKVAGPFDGSLTRRSS